MSLGKKWALALSTHRRKKRSVGVDEGGSTVRLDQRHTQEKCHQRTESNSYTKNQKRISHFRCIGPGGLIITATHVASSSTVTIRTLHVSSPCSHCERVSVGVVFVVVASPSPLTRTSPFASPPSLLVTSASAAAMPSFASAVAPPIIQPTDNSKPKISSSNLF